MDAVENAVSAIRAARGGNPAQALFWAGQLQAAAADALVALAPKVYGDLYLTPTATSGPPDPPPGRPEPRGGI